MISTISNGVKFQQGAGLSGYVAELGSCFLCADLEIVPELEPRQDHASYLASWLK
jgi:antirestriction protein ArdC